MRIPLNVTRMALLALLATISTINVSAASLSPSDSRKLSGVDPRTTFPGHPKSKYRLLVGNSSPELTTVSDPGWRDPKTSDYTVLRTSDPTNGGKKAFRHRVKKGMTYRQDNGYQSGRAEAHTNWGSSSNAVPGVPYWAVYAFYVDADHPFNGSGDDLGHPGNRAPSDQQERYAESSVLPAPKRDHGCVG